MKTNRSVGQRILRIPLFQKILLVNSVIVGLGAAAGTLITVGYVRSDPQNIHYELIAFFAVTGIILSFVVNKWVLKRALRPLDRLQRAVNRIRRGQQNVRVRPGRVSDEQFDRLVEAFNEMVIEHEQYSEQMQRLPRRILQAQEEERQRLARELHDEAAQALTSLLVHLRLLERAHDPEKAQQQVQTLRDMTAQALEDVRRVALDLRPTILDDLGLGPALEWRVEEFNKVSGVHTTISIDGLERRLPRDIELIFYRVGQEALSNIARHAQAKNVAVSLRQENEVISLEIVDDGLGFEAVSTPKTNGHGLGLVGMRERMAMVEGSLAIQTEPGQGTRIVAQASLQNNAPDGVKHG